MKSIRFLIVLVMWLTTGATMQARPLSDTAVMPDVVASGAGASSSTGYSIVSTVAMPGIGNGGSLDYNLCSGYWCGVSPMNAHLYVPILRRV